MAILTKFVRFCPFKLIVVTNCLQYDVQIEMLKQTHTNFCDFYVANESYDRLY